MLSQGPLTLDELTDLGPMLVLRPRVADEKPVKEPPHPSQDDDDDAAGGGHGFYSLSRWILSTLLPMA